MLPPLSQTFNYSTGLWTSWNMNRLPHFPYISWLPFHNTFVALNDTNYSLTICNDCGMWRLNEGEKLPCLFAKGLEWSKHYSEIKVTVLGECTQSQRNMCMHVTGDVISRNEYCVHVYLGKFRIIDISRVSINKHINYFETKGPRLRTGQFHRCNSLRVLVKTVEQLVYTYVCP